MEFDYVIVGAGSAGCVLASRLSESREVTVCLLEAGPPDRNPFIHMPLGILWMMRSPALNWRYHTAPEPELAGRRLFWPRGRTLGGSSSSNAMCYMRGHPQDYDDWAAAGNPGWSFAEVLPYFLRGEHNERGASAFHGSGGPLNVTELRSPNTLTHAFIAAGVQAGLPPNTDFNGAEQEGVGLFQVTQKGGQRCSAAKAYLGPARDRPNLTILTDAQATRITLAGKRACGVEFLRQGQTQAVRARREVLVCGGAINSPQLLMLSGIGNGPDLQALGIPVAAHLPGVGQNLQDHLDVILVQASRQHVSWGFTPRILAGRGLLEFYRYLKHRRGMCTSNGAEGCAFSRSSPDERIPDLQFHFTPARLRNHGRDIGFMTGEGYSLHVCNLRPKSRGAIRLASRDPLAKPHIQANYLSHPEDMDKMVAGVKWVRRILAAPAFDPYRGPELVPGPGVHSDDEIRDFVRAKAETIYHPVGTCRMGSDPMAVVDAELRVHGVEGLRVVDASMMPTLIGGNTNAPVMMIAERAADLVKAAWCSQPRAAVITPAAPAAPFVREPLQPAAT